MRMYLNVGIPQYIRIDNLIYNDGNIISISNNRSSSSSNYVNARSFIC